MTAPEHGYVRRLVERWRHGQITQEDDFIAEEVPIAMVYNDASFAVMMATPHDLDDFALGFSLSEGLINDPSQLLQLEIHPLLEGIELAMRVPESARGAHLDRDRERLLPGVAVAVFAAHAIWKTRYGTTTRWAPATASRVTRWSWRCSSCRHASR